MVYNMQSDGSQVSGSIKYAWYNMQSDGSQVYFTSLFHKFISGMEL